MGIETADVGMTDEALFDSAMNDAPAQEAPAAVVEQQPEEPAVARDDKGRFAAKQAEEQEALQQQAQPGGERKEPPEFRFREVSEAKRQAEERASAMEAQNRALMAMLQQFQPQQREPEAPKAPEIWDNPDEWGSHKFKEIVTPELQQLRQMIDGNSRLIAAQLHTPDAVEAAAAAFKQAVEAKTLHPAEFQQVMGSANRYDAAVKWHAKASVMAEYGSDPEAFKQKIINDYLASQKQPAQAGQQQPGGSVVRLPPSLNRATSAASDASSDADMSDAALFAQATRR
jgi:hypothetical protein